MHTVTKSYRDLPAAHRQPNHDGHCRLIHGHNWGFDITFRCVQLDENGFVIDVGKLDWVKKFLVENFDHTLLLNQDDPNLVWMRKNFSGATVQGSLAIIVAVPNCGMEGLAKYVYDTLQFRLKDHERGLRVVSVVCWEDAKNSSTYVDPSGGVATVT